MIPRIRTTPRTSPRRKAFSLVELLVVIGVITVLISMLMPAIAKVRRQAGSAACKSNLRQCGLHLLMYANHHNGWLFPVGWGSDVPRPKRWPVYVFDPPTWNPRVLLCPDDLSPKEEHSYVLNRHLADKGVRYGSGRVAGLSPSDVVVMGEKVSSRNDYYLEFLDGQTEFFGVVEPYRHGINVGSNYLYLDLHVDSASPRQAKDAIDPWDVPGERKQPSK